MVRLGLLIALRTPLGRKRAMAKWLPKCGEIDPQIDFWVTFGRFLATKSAHRLVMWASRCAGKAFRRQIGPGTRPGVRTSAFWSVFSWKCGSNGSPWWSQNRFQINFWTKDVARRLKNWILYRFWKNIKKVWKIDRKIIDFEVPATSWPTFLLQPASAGTWFSFFQKFRKNEKNDAKMVTQILEN